MAPKKNNKTCKNIWFYDFEHPQRTEEVYYHRTSLICGRKLWTRETMSFISLEDWFNYLLNLDQYTVIYFHNLKYDSHAFMHYLLDNNIAFKETICEEGRVIKITLDTLNGAKIDFRCSHVLLGGSVKSWGKFVSSVLNINFPKLKYDYTKIGRYNSVSEVPKDLMEYCQVDVDIMVYTLEILWNYLIKNKDGAPDEKTKYMLPKLSAAAIAKMNLIKMMGDNVRYWRDLAKQWYPAEMIEDIGQEEFYDVYMKPFYDSYFGGITYGNPKYKEKEVTGQMHKIDINSSYPNSMLGNLPYGKPSPTPYEGVKNMKFYKVWLIKARLKPQYIIPNLAKGKRCADEISWVEHKWYHWGEGYGVRIIPEEEYDLIMKRNEVVMDNDKTQIMYFKCTPYLKKFIDHFYHIKQTSTGAPKLMAKLCLNSSYGKFGENPLRYAKVLQRVKNGLYYPWEVDESKIKKLDLKEDTSYPPTAMVISARSRNALVKAVDLQGENFLYSDTDSIILIGHPKGLDLHEDRIGAWKLESNPKDIKGDLTITKFKWLKPKCYATYDIIEGYNFVVSGLDKDKQSELKWEEFERGLEVPNKHMERRYGYVSLEEGKYEI